MNLPLALTLLFASPHADTDSIAALISAERLMADIAFLSDDAFAGRDARSDEARRAAEFIANRFRAAGLSPLEGASGFFHCVSDPSMAPNVIATRPGRGRDFVIVSAHYDHLGVDTSPTTRPDRIFNGADDNASGVAAILAIAEALQAADPPLDASIVFIAFTGEEQGLRGSRMVAGKPPFPLQRVRGMFNLDMIGRGEEDLIFIDGGRQADRLRAALRSANESGKLGLRLRFDEHPEWLDRSDQGPFIRRRVPAVLLSVEDHPDYHEVTDHADRILPRLVERVTRLVLLATIDLASDPSPSPTTQPGG
ncbi:MAG: M20/M25/M40 family metallo-hydrolase [Phycisphaerae bacterium]|nr:M20/M25/M40 family metallo-hydrolase [Phycisphaerae bacterium]MDW8262819.1 M20/M25/M40 family metallo-hydrolase [Phycisphaerales bacterium]